jgi:flagellar biosynthetic protein FliO
MDTASTFAMFMRLLLSLSIVIGLMWAAATVLRKRGFGGQMNRKSARSVQVEMLAKRNISRNTSIAVVRVGERSMVVGITDHQITKLDDAEVVEEIDLEDDTTGTVSQGPTSPATAWKMMLDQMRTRTVRR